MAGSIADAFFELLHSLQAREKRQRESLEKTELQIEAVLKQIGDKE